jgi:hypothetical protein
VSSKRARPQRRQASNLKRYARLRRAGRVPQHTQAERRLAAAERERQCEAEQRRTVWLRRAILLVATVVTAAAGIATFTVAPAMGGLGHAHHPYSAVSQLHLSVPLDPDHPDPPHVPDPDSTFYTDYDGSSTSTSTAHGLASRAAFKQAYGLDLFND